MNEPTEKYLAYHEANCRLKNLLVTNVPDNPKDYAQLQYEITITRLDADRLYQEFLEDEIL